MEYSVRIDIPALKDPEEGFKQWLIKHCQDYTVAYETVDGQNPHYQGYLKSTFADSTLRRRLTELLTQSGNRAYSLVKLKKTREELLQYVCKDSDVRYTTLTEAELQIYKDLGSARKQEVEAARVRKESKKSVIQRLREELNLDDVERREEVAERVIRWYAESDVIFPSNHILINYINTLYIGILRKKRERYESFLKYYPAYVLGSDQARRALECDCKW